MYQVHNGNCLLILKDLSKLYNPTDSSSQHLFHMQPSQNIWQHPLFRQNFRGAETQVDNRTFNYTSFLLSILEFPMDLRMRKDRIHYLQKVQYTVAFFPLLNQTVKNLKNIQNLNSV